MMFTKMKIKPFLYIRENIANQKYNESSFQIEGHEPSLYFFLFCYIYEILLKLYYNSMQD